MLNTNNCYISPCITIKLGPTDGICDHIKVVICECHISFQEVYGNLPFNIMKAWGLYGWSGSWFPLNATNIELVQNHYIDFVHILVCFILAFAMLFLHLSNATQKYWKRVIIIFSFFLYLALKFRPLEKLWIAHVIKGIGACGFVCHRLHLLF